MIVGVSIAWLLVLYLPYEGTFFFFRGGGGVRTGTHFDLALYYLNFSLLSSERNFSSFVCTFPSFLKHRLHFMSKNITNSPIFGISPYTSLPTYITAKNMSVFLVLCILNHVSFRGPTCKYSRALDQPLPK
jgi:hypothetical protein